MDNKLKMLRGGYRAILNKDETLLFSFNRNTIYVNDLINLKCIKTFKALSHIAYIALSSDETKIAVKNTSGQIMVLSYPDGTILGTSKMERYEGYQIYFIENDKYILDMDWQGNCMKLSLSSFEYKIIFNGYPIWNGWTFMYDIYENKIILINDCLNKIIENKLTADSFITVENKSKFSLLGIGNKCFCSKNFIVLYYITNNDLTICDKSLDITNKVQINHQSYITDIIISNNEKYLISICPDEAILFNFPKIEPLKTYNYPYMSSVVFSEKQNKIAIATWNGIIIEDLI